MSRLLLRSLAHYWRTNLAVVAGVATAVAVLTGALMVGHSVRESLRAILLQRLGATEVLIASQGFFREDLAAALAASDVGVTANASPLIHVVGALAREQTRHSSRSVQVYGVDDRFWNFHGMERTGPDGRTALLGRAAADALGVGPGDTLLLRVETKSVIPKESLYGRRDDAGRTIRLTCGGILGSDELGEFSLQSGQGSVLAVFVPLARLQRDLGQPDRANVALIGSSPGPVSLTRIRESLERAMSLEDAGVVLRPLPSGRGVAVESERILLDDNLASAAAGAAAEAGLPASGVFSYLANTIRANGREIPYSVITAADLGQGALASVKWIDRAGAPSTPIAPDAAIWLNEWAWRELGASPGDPVEVDYYRWLDDGRLTTETAGFRLAGVVATGGDIDATLAPNVPGISDARDIYSWDPPFPMDLGRIRPSDDAYWRLHNATPKAFVTLARGQQLWSSRFGQLSSLRVMQSAELFAPRLRARLGPGAGGLAVVPIRARGLEAAEGSTDFGEYFVYFSFFLIVAAVLLAAMFFRLGVEQRVREIGLLQAVGYSDAAIRRLFLLEGAVLAGAGGLIGLGGAVVYGGAMMAGLRTWWVGAVGTREVFLHVSPADLVAGLALGVAAALVAVPVTLRSLRGASARAMLAGVLETSAARGHRRRLAGAGALVALAAAAGLMAGAAAGRVPQVAGFFGSGMLLLVSMLGGSAVWLRRAPHRAITAPGWRAVVRLGARYVAYRPGRSLLCIALIAFATFVIVSVEAFRKDAGSDHSSPSSGSGGFALIARSVIPVVHDPNTVAGREALGLASLPPAVASRLRFVSFRERPGDDASCLNLYAPGEPRILGASSAFLREGRFSFQASLATTPEETGNPWLLLESRPPGGAIPAIADAVTIQYILHRTLGDELIVHGGDGRPVRLRLVAALRDSVLQGELIIAERRFLQAFPAQEGYRAFLLDVPWGDTDAIAGRLEEALSQWGFTIESSAARLAAYHRVENTYLSTFQSLGALGLLLGTIGLVAVLLRNVFERRRELALLRAVGYHRVALAAVIAVENALVVAVGLVCGSACAAVAIGPALLARGGGVPIAASGVMIGIVLAGGVVSSLAAAVAVWRMPLLAAIRSE